jgi:tRNA nucleotidyltransferase/poly(A) polymerase
VRFDFTIDDATVAAIRQRAERITSIVAERVTYELHATFSAGRFRKALQLLNATGLDEPLFGFQVDSDQFQADDVSLAAAYALVLRNPKEFAKRWKWSDALLRDVTKLQQLLRNPNPIALYDAGEKLARQLPLRVPMPDFSIKPLLDGHEIGELTGLEGPRLGAMKRALLEAQIRGEVSTRDDAERFVLSV